MVSAISNPSPVARAFARAAENYRGTFVGYLPIGFPDLNTSIRAAIELARSGADVLELGLPYSDPVMDGPVIQSATQRALSAGFRVHDVFTVVREVRQALDQEGIYTPLLVMSYWNPVLQHGVQRFADDLAEAGGAGIITPDITPDSAADWLQASKQSGLDRVFLAAPSSSSARIKLTVESSRGFVYAVSTMGITGLRHEVDAAARGLTARLRDAGASGPKTLPVAVGIGISTAAHLREVLGYADGAIVGSALVTALDKGGVGGLTRLATELAQGAANPARP